jgi:molybdopterin converting factor small subunit
MPQVTFVSNVGAGSAGKVEIKSGQTLQSFFAAKMRGKDMSNFNIRVNQKKAGPDTILKHNDIVSITPTKIDAGR